MAMPDWWARSDALRDVLVEIGHMPPAQRKFDLAEIQPGWHVFDRDLVPVGRVEAVIGRYVTVRRFRWGSSCGSGCTSRIRPSAKLMRARYC
jgi:hypothetical protein